METVVLDKVLENKWVPTHVGLDQPAIRELTYSGSLHVTETRYKHWCNMVRYMCSVSPTKLNHYPVHTTIRVDKD